MGLRKDISKTEFIVYVAIWSAAVVYSIYCFARSANKRFQHYDDLYSDFDQGWPLLSRKKDVGDFEWRAIKSLLKTLSYWIVPFTFSSEIIRYFNLFQILPIWQVLTSLAFVITELGVYPLGLLLYQPLLSLLVLSATRNKAIIWMTSSIALLSILMYRNLCVTEECLNTLGLNVHTAYLHSISLFWTNLRCLSCCMYIIDSKERHINIKFLAYCLYLPILIGGPFISFEDFKSCYQFSGNIKRRSLELLINVVRFLFWIVFVEFFLHFVYINTIEFHPEWIRSFDLMSLYGYGYTLGQFFHMKYLVLYGLAITFSKFENVQVPSLPVCIGRIHLYSDMWKYFDAGLYNFLLRCIYIPLMKNHWIQNRFLASLICFIFVYVWHGLEYYILVWSTLNYCGIVLENVCTSIGENFFKKTNIGQKWSRRITCIAASPLLVMSAISNFYFFARDEIGNIFTSRTLNAGIQATVILLAIMYTCCQVSTEVKYQLHDKTRKEKIK